jgi:hypothetical protein
MTNILQSANTTDSDSDTARQIAPVLILFVISIVVLSICGTLLAWCIFLSWGGLTHIEYVHQRRSAKIDGSKRVWSWLEARNVKIEQGLDNVRKLWGVKGSWAAWIVEDGHVLGWLLIDKSRRRAR